MGTSGIVVVLVGKSMNDVGSVVPKQGPNPRRTRDKYGN